MATFGPLYKTVGGDHLSRLRGGLEHGYNHLILDTGDYQDFVEHMSVPGVDVIDGSPVLGRLYIEQDLFSHWGWRDYHSLFDEVLDVQVFTCHVDPEAVEFRDRFRAKWSLLLEKGHSEEDLLISTLVVLGQFKAASA